MKNESERSASNEFGTDITRERYKEVSDLYSKFKKETGLDFVISSLVLGIDENGDLGQLYDKTKATVDQFCSENNISHSELREWAKTNSELKSRRENFEYGKKMFKD